MRIVVSPSGKFQPGDRVRVTDGPFKGMEGVVESGAVSIHKVRVTIAIFGRVTPIELFESQLERTD